MWVADWANEVNPPLDEQAHIWLNATNPSVNSLAHHGIKGMHWGVRIRNRSAYGEAKAAERQQIRDRKPSRVIARKLTEVASDPRSATTFATTAAVGVAFMRSPSGKAVMKTSLAKAGKVAATNKKVQRTTFKILKGAVKLYIKAR